MILQWGSVHDQGLKLSFELYSESEHDGDIPLSASMLGYSSPVGDCMVLNQIPKYRDEPILREFE